jgi:hypothetical protein
MTGERERTAWRNGLVECTAVSAGECHCQLFTEQVEFRAEHFETFKFSHLYAQTTAISGENFNELVAYF